MSEAKVTARKEIVEGILGTYENCISRGNGHQQSKQQAIAWLDASEGRLEAALAARPKAWTLEEIKAAFRRTTPRTAEYELQLMEFTQRLASPQPTAQVQPVEPEWSKRIHIGFDGMMDDLPQEQPVCSCDDRAATTCRVHDEQPAFISGLNSQEAIDAEKRAQPAESQLTYPQSIPTEDCYFAWARWNGRTYVTCDCNQEGAFKAYRHPKEEIKKVICNDCNSEVIFSYEGVFKAYDGVKLIRIYHSCKDGEQVKGLLAEAEQKARREGIEEMVAFVLDELGDEIIADQLEAKFLPQPTPEERVTVHYPSGGESIQVKLDGTLSYTFEIYEFKEAEIYRLGLIAQLKGGTK